jgi:hypothetical protein
VNTEHTSPHIAGTLLAMARTGMTSTCENCRPRPRVNTESMLTRSEDLLAYTPPRPDRVRQRSTKSCLALSSTVTLRHNPSSFNASQGGPLNQTSRRANQTYHNTPAKVPSTLCGKVTVAMRWRFCWCVMVRFVSSVCGLIFGTTHYDVLAAELGRWYGCTTM